MAQEIHTGQNDHKTDPSIDTVGMGSRIKAIRKTKGITQKKMAKDLNITYQYMSMTETGRRQISLSMLVAIANYLETTTDYLLTGHVSEKAQVPGTNEYMDIMKDLKPRERAVVMNVAKAAKEAIRNS